jgi:hypothetical protein
VIKFTYYFFFLPVYPPKYLEPGKKKSGKLFIAVRWFELIALPPLRLRDRDREKRWRTVENLNEFRRQEARKKGKENRESRENEGTERHATEKDRRRI